jgi:hypothetical protein
LGKLGLFAQLGVINGESSWRITVVAVVEYAGRGNPARNIVAIVEYARGR